ncbi:MAG: SDR family NAD(P)-dependent oxidoreductase [Flavobacteriaceae bacterium]|nr:SDR family NAD(P)-dependent oxidoreductase [Flavobacteriaceae bacterium]
MDGRAACINVSSVSGKISSSPLGAYAASKFALEAISEALAGEVKPFNIRVRIVEPGIINTDMAQDIKDDSASVYPQVRGGSGISLLPL